MPSTEHFTKDIFTKSPVAFPALLLSTFWNFLRFLKCYLTVSSPLNVRARLEKEVFKFVKKHKIFFFFVNSISVL